MKLSSWAWCSHHLMLHFGGGAEAVAWISEGAGKGAVSGACEGAGPGAEAETGVGECAGAEAEEEACEGAGAGAGTGASEGAGGWNKLENYSHLATHASNVCKEWHFIIQLWNLECIKFYLSYWNQSLEWDTKHLYYVTFYVIYDHMVQCVVTSQSVIEWLGALASWPD